MKFKVLHAAGAAVSGNHIWEPQMQHLRVFLLKLLLRVTSLTGTAVSCWKWVSAGPGVTRPAIVL